MKLFKTGKNLKEQLTAAATKQMTTNQIDSSTEDEVLTMPPPVAIIATNANGPPSWISALTKESDFPCLNNSSTITTTTTATTTTTVRTTTEAQQENACETCNEGETAAVLYPPRKGGRPKDTTNAAADRFETLKKLAYTAAAQQCIDAKQQANLDSKKLAPGTFKAIIKKVIELSDLPIGTLNYQTVTSESVF
jgi:hypothetical protein